MIPGSEIGWHEFADRDALATALARDVVARLCEGIAANGAAILVVSGGTTPRRFFETLSREALDWPRITVTLADERCVAPVSERANAHLVREALLRGAAAAAHFVPLWSALDDTMAEPADADDGLVTARARIGALALPFDAVVLGMGGDGHFASLFPNGDRTAEGLDPETRERVLPIRAPILPEPRLTLTLPTLLAARSLHLHIEGEDKRAVLTRALRAGVDAAELPIAAVVRAARVLLGVYWCA